MVTNRGTTDIDIVGLVLGWGGQNLGVNNGQVREKIIEAVIGCQSLGGRLGVTPDWAGGRPAQSTQSQAGSDITKNDSPARLGPPAVTRHGLEDAACVQTGRTTDTWDPARPGSWHQADKHSMKRCGPSIRKIQASHSDIKTIAKSSAEGEVVSRPRGRMCALFRAPRTLGKGPRLL